VREALTVVGFLLIVAFVAIFAAPLYMDWGAWRETIAAKLSDHLGAPVSIEGPIEARLLPQPWLSLRSVTVGAPGSPTSLHVEGVEGDLNLAALLRGDIEVTSLVLDAPALTVTTAEDGAIAPLSHGLAQSATMIESFEVQGGSVRYADARARQDITLDGIHLVGEARSLAGPYKAEGGLQLGGVPHTLKLATGRGASGDVRLKLSVVPADRPLTLDLDGGLSVKDGRPVFDGLGVLARPPVNTRGDKEPPREPWTISARMKLTPSSLIADTVDVQVGPDERALKLSGGASAIFGPETRIDAMLTATQLELDRLAGVTPDKRVPPLMVLSRLKEGFASIGDLPVTMRIDLSAQGVMLGSQMVQQVKANLSSAGKGWNVSHFEANLPGQSRLVLKGDVGEVAGGNTFGGTIALESRRASNLIAWLQADDRPSAPNAARSMTLESGIRASEDIVSLSNLRLAVDDATVEGGLSWTRLEPDAPTGRVEADLRAHRLDLDALPSAAALLPGGLASLSEADVRLSAESLAFAGIEAKSANGRIRAGGRLVALEDVTIDDLGGSSLTANGRIDNMGEKPEGEVRIRVDGRDLTGLAAALQRSPLPRQLVDAFAARARALSPASADLVIAFGDGRHVSLDGKLGGTVTQIAADLTGPQERPDVSLRLKGDSLDVVALLQQMGVSSAPTKLPGRATVQAALEGPLDGVRRWSAQFDGGGLSVEGSGRLTGPFGNVAVDGRLRARAPDIMSPAQLFGVALPGALPGDGLDLDTGFRSRGGRLVLDDLTAAALGMSASGAVTLDAGAAPRIEGNLTFRSVDAFRLASLLAGADLSDPPAKGSAWPGSPFGASALAGLAGTINLSAGELWLSPRLPPAADAKGTLSFDQGSATLDGFSARIAGGGLGATLKLSRSALDTALTGRVALTDIHLDTQPLAGRLDLAADVQGTGRTAASLVSSLTGGGTFALRQPRFGALSEGAFAATVAAVDEGLPAQAEKVRTLFEQRLGEAPLQTADISGSLSLAGGVLRLATATTHGGAIGLALSGSVDLADLTARADIILTPPAPGDGLGGPAPAIQISESGPFDALARKVDVSALTAWLTVRSAEREAKKLEALEAERAAREKAAEEARRAEAERLRQLIEAQKAAEAAAAEAAAAAAKRAEEAAAAKAAAAKAAAEAAPKLIPEEGSTPPSPDGAGSPPVESPGNPVPERPSSGSAASPAAAPPPNSPPLVAPATQPAPPVQPSGPGASQSRGSAPLPLGEGSVRPPAAKLPARGSTPPPRPPIPANARMGGSDPDTTNALPAPFQMPQFPAPAFGAE
jgi:uncharacterized protein involved in outer membrane biogenesis